MLRYSNKQQTGWDGVIHMSSEKNLLQNVYLFKGLNQQQLEDINKIAELCTYTPGEDIFAQDDVAKALYIIKYGSVRIHQKTKSGDNVEVAMLATGSHFGEIAFLDGEKRSATATAVEKSDIVVLDYEKLGVILKGNAPMAVHFYRELAHFLCGRLRITTNDLSFAREKNVRHF